jgi:glycosyltransferase involved in cell wall biosynthesis
LPIALDATYAVGSQLTGVGAYCREMLHGLAATHGEQTFRWAYRPHRFLRARQQSVPHNCTRRLLLDAIPLRADLFHGLNQRMPAWRARRTVTTFHDLFVMTGEYSSPGFRQRFAKLAKDAAERSDLIITVSHSTATQVHRLLAVEWDRLRVVHHGVRLPRLPNVAREPIVLSVGAVQKRKNTARLIEAFRAIPAPWKLVLAGAAGFGAEQILANAGPRVEVTGYVTDEQLAALYARASIFAFPSLDEGFGIPVLEAMSAGVPVIASNTSALPEVCGEAAILIDPLDVHQLASELERLAADPELRAQIAKRGRSRAAGFTWNLAVEKTWSVYRELLGP